MIVASVDVLSDTQASVLITYSVCILMSYIRVDGDLLWCAVHARACVLITRCYAEARGRLEATQKCSDAHAGTLNFQ